MNEERDELFAKLEASLMIALNQFRYTLQDRTADFIGELIENAEYGLASDILLENLKLEQQDKSLRGYAELLSARGLMGLMPGNG